VKARVVQADKVRRVPVEHAEGAFIQVLIGPEEAPNFVLRRFTLLPGGRIPRHRHPDLEHEQYVLAGRMRIGLDDRVYQVGPGDVVFIPPGVAHWYENPGEDPVLFLCIVPRTAEYKTEWLE